MITTHQARLINQENKYVSRCSGVFLTRDPLKPWAAWFKTKGIEAPLGHFEREEEAIKAYNEYHERYYTDLLTKIKKEKEDESKRD